MRLQVREDAKAFTVFGSVMAQVVGSSGLDAVCSACVLGITSNK